MPDARCLLAACSLQFACFLQFACKMQPFSHGRTPLSATLSVIYRRIITALSAAASPRPSSRPKQPLVCLPRTTARRLYAVEAKLSPPSSRSTLHHTSGFSPVTPLGVLQTGTLYEDCGQLRQLSGHRRRNSPCRLQKLLQPGNLPTLET